MTLKREIKDAYIEKGAPIYVKTHSNAVYVDDNETETLTEKLDNVKSSIAEHTTQLNDIKNNIYSVYNVKLNNNIINENASVLYFPKGVYTISYATFNNSVTILGDGEGTILKIKQFEFNSDVVIKDICIQKNETGNNSRASIRINSENKKNVYIKNVKFNNSSDENVDANKVHILVYGANNVNITECSFYNSGNTFNNCNININNSSFYMNFKNTIESSVHCAKNVTGKIECCKFYDSYDAPIDLYPNAHNMIISNNSFYNCDSTLLTLKAILRESGSEDEQLNDSTNKSGTIHDIVFEKNFVKDCKEPSPLFIRITTRDERTTDPVKNDEQYYINNIKIADNVFDFESCEFSDKFIFSKICGAKNIEISNNIVKTPSSEFTFLNFDNETGVHQHCKNIMIKNNHIFSKYSNTVYFATSNVDLEIKDIFIYNNRFEGNGSSYTFLFMKGICDTIYLNENMYNNIMSTSSATHRINSTKNLYISNETITDLTLKGEYTNIKIQNTYLQKITSDGVINNLILDGCNFSHIRSWLDSGVFNSGTINEMILKNNCFMNKYDKYCLTNTGSIESCIIQANVSKFNFIWDTVNGKKPKSFSNNNIFE